MKASIRSFFESKLLPGDHGRPLELTPLLEAGIAAYEAGPKRTTVIVAPRRQGKSSLASLWAGFELLLVPGSFVVWIAGSGDQASDVLTQKLGLPLRRLRDHALRSLGVELQYSRTRLTNLSSGSTVEILAPTEVSSLGRTVSTLIVDEARGVPEEVMELLRPSAINGRVLVIGSPGAPRGWFHRAVTEPNPGDHVFHFREILNPAIDPATVEAERARLAKRGSWGELMARREWGGEWVDLSENPLCRPLDVQRGSVTPDGIAPYDRELDTVAIGVDLSTHRDLTSAVVVAQRGEDDAARLRLLEVWSVDPKVTGPIDLAVVERKLEELWRRYNPITIAVDRFQSMGMVQALRLKGCPIEDLAVTAAVNQEAFSALTEALSQGRLSWARNERLEAELLNLELRETVSGFSVKDRDARYHRDLAWSLAAATWQLLKAPRSKAAPITLVATGSPTENNRRAFARSSYRDPRCDPGPAVGASTGPGWANFFRRS